jgi:retron-type reverse transcriptase
MPSAHAPGPDGFNGFSMKHCWQIIVEGYYRLCEGFCNGSVDLECINGSFITLLRKKDTPLYVNDYRPISLLNYSLKLITNILANRLQKVITSVIHANQYGFIKGRTIQDRLAWAFKFLHTCHHSKREILIVKLDFENAFDKVEHQVILDMFKHKGFSEKWIQWIQMILSSGSSSVLLNGVPGKSFKCKRGDRQGDPLSPLLFVMAADLLQSIVNNAAHIGHLQHPLGDSFGGDYPIM